MVVVVGATGFKVAEEEEGFLAEGVEVGARGCFAVKDFWKKAECKDS